MKTKKLKLASVMILGTVVLASCSNPFDQLADEINSYLAGGDGTEEPAEVDEAADMPEEEAVPEETEESAENAEEPAEAEEDAEMDPMYEPIDYTHLYGQGEETSISAGDYTVGEDIVPGRYSVTSTGEYSGYLSIYDEEDRYVAGEVLASEDMGEALPDYPEEALFYIDEGDKIEVSNNNTFVFTPVDGPFDGELSPGMYVAGHDIEAGDYRISTADTELSGSIYVHQIEAYDSGRYSIGNPEYGGKDSFVMTFDEGDLVEITGVKSVSVEKLD